MKWVSHSEHSRIELHTHSLLSDGKFIPIELVSRAQAIGIEAIAITDHCGANVREVVEKLKAELELVKKFWKIRAIVGVELTHVPPQSIAELAGEAKRAGAELVIVHGETIVEPVPENTNEFAACCEDVDIIAHPGLITYSAAKKAQEHGVLLEISSRQGHCLTNGHVVKVGKSVGASFVVNSDAHSSDELLTAEKAYKVALGSGLSEEEAYMAIEENPRKLLLSLKP